MDLLDIETTADHEAGAECRIRSPKTGKPTDFYITVLGPDSKKYREAQGQLYRAIMDKKESGSTDFLAAITTDWRGLTDNKKPVAFSKKAVKSIYMNAPYIANQVDSFIGDRVNFIKG
jgi:hypothetical protein